MRVVLVIAAVALLYAAGPADAANKALGRTARAAAVRRQGRRRARRPAHRVPPRRRPPPVRRPPLRLRALAAHRRGERGPDRRPACLRRPRRVRHRAGRRRPGRRPAPATGRPRPARPPGPRSRPLYSNPLALQVRAYEFFFRLSKSTVAAGDVKVEFNLAAAQDPHNLFLVREDGTGSAYAFGESGPGDVTTKTVPLTAGRWILLCSLTGHEAAGMRSTLTVG